MFAYYDQQPSPWHDVNQMLRQQITISFIRNMTHTYCHLNNCCSLVYEFRWRKIGSSNANGWQV